MLWKLNKNLMKSNHPDRFVTLEFADLRAVAIPYTGVLLHWDVQKMPMQNIHPSWAILFALFTLVQSN